MISKQPDDWSLRQWPFSSCLTTADFWFFSEAYMVALLYSCRFIEMQDGLPGVVLIKCEWHEQLLTVIRKMESVFYIWRLVQNCRRPLLPMHMADKWPWSIITIQETISQVCILIYTLIFTPVQGINGGKCTQNSPCQKKVNPELCVQYLKSISTIPESRAHVKQTDRQDRASDLSFLGNSPLVPRLLLHPG
jgi:hypothetical protein